jgi:hypothetical protein
MTLYPEVSVNLKGRNHMSDRDTDGKILLKWTLMKLSARV